MPAKSNFSPLASHSRLNFSRACLPRQSSSAHKNATNVARQASVNNDRLKFRRQNSQRIKATASTAMTARTTAKSRENAADSAGELVLPMSSPTPKITTNAAAASKVNQSSRPRGPLQGFFQKLFGFSSINSFCRSRGNETQTSLQ